MYHSLAEPKSLCASFEGPYKIVNRPSRTQITVRVGSFADGQPRLLTYNWSSCKPARLREGAKESSRPNVGRRPNPPNTQNRLNVNNNASTGIDVATDQSSHETSIPAFDGSASTGPPAGSPFPHRPQRSTRNPNPKYVDAASVTWSASQSDLESINRSIGG